MQTTTKLYEDNLCGKVTDVLFSRMSVQYENELSDLQKKIDQAADELGQLEAKKDGKNHFVTAIRKFMKIDVLTPQLLHELIDSIYIHHGEGQGKKRTQRIEIHYRFVGSIGVPSDKKAAYTLDTRHGVAVNYITKDA